MSAAEALVEPWIPSDVSHREWADWLLERRS